MTTLLEIKKEITEIKKEVTKLHENLNNSKENKEEEDSHYNVRIVILYFLYIYK